MVFLVSESYLQNRKLNFKIAKNSGQAMVELMHFIFSANNQYSINNNANVAHILP